MRLVYYYESYYGRGEKPMEVNFCSHFEFKFLESEKSYHFKNGTIELIKDSRNINTSLFGSVSTHLSLIVGANRSGKTTLLKKLCNEIGSSFESTSIFIFFDDITDTFRLWKNEFSKLIFIGFLPEIYDHPSLDDESEDENDWKMEGGENTPKINLLWFSNIIDYNQQDFFSQRIVDLSFRSKLLKGEFRKVRYEFFDAVFKLFNSHLDLAGINQNHTILINGEYNNMVRYSFKSFKKYVEIQEWLDEVFRADFIGYTNELSNADKLIFLKKAILWNILSYNLKDFLKKIDGLLMSNSGKKINVELIIKYLYEQEFKVFDIFFNTPNLIYSVKNIEIEIGTFFIDKQMKDYGVSYRVVSNSELNEQGENFALLFLDLFKEDSASDKLLNSNINVDFEELSSGESNILSLYSSFFNYKNHEEYKFIKIDENIEKSFNPGWPILFFIDEGELGLHPEWQRQYIKLLIDNMPKVLGTDKIQFIVSTHSPLLTSDVPTGNIIYLENHAVINRHVRTFGANIHSLYKDSFFLEGGLIGEFAKEKIEDLIQFLLPNKKRKDGYENIDQTFTPDSAQELIDIIGEPFIQTKIQDLYNSKYGKEIEISRLENRLKILKGGRL